MWCFLLGHSVNNLLNKTWIVSFYSRLWWSPSWTHSAFSLEAISSPGMNTTSSWIQWWGTLVATEMEETTEKICSMKITVLTTSEGSKLARTLLRPFSRQIISNRATSTSFPKWSTSQSASSSSSSHTQKSRTCSISFTQSAIKGKISHNNNNPT